jgi:hypothetical protein
MMDQDMFVKNIGFILFPDLESVEAISTIKTPFPILQKYTPKLSRNDGAKRCCFAEKK